MSSVCVRPTFFAAFLIILSGCQDLLMPQAPGENELLDGPVAGLSHEQQARFLAGDIAFNDEVFTPETGLGPLFVATSCGTCHAGDGKGHPFTSLVRFGQTNSTGNQFLDQGGPQLQHRAIPGFTPETIPDGATYTRLIPPANTGLGFLEAVPDETLLALADPDDLDGDGISGRPNWIDLPDFVVPKANAITQDGKYIGRFGKKGAVYDLLQQTVNAYNQDIGITSTFAPVDTYSDLTIDPEISNKTIRDVVFYLETLKAPMRRNEYNPVVKEGQQLFTDAGCAACHVPQLQTGPSPIAPLAYKTIYPYTDLLLHDMGPELDDGYTEGDALTSEWRTPPLWGLGLSRNSQGNRMFLMHDGRARGILEAIDLHGGEAAATRAYVQQLSDSQKKALIKFLESL